MKTYFSTNVSFRPVETYFLSSGNVSFCLESFFLPLKTMIEIRGKTEKHYPASGDHFRFFYKEKQFFRIKETNFSTSVSFRVMETTFLASKNHKLSVYWKHIFLRILHFSYWRRILFLVESVYFTR